MVSPKKLQANRSNAQASTGPRTPQGKAVSARNALKHGLLSRDVLIPGEDSDALAALDRRLRNEFSPVGELETVLVDRILRALWRLRRLDRVEADIFAAEIYQRAAHSAHGEASSYTRQEPSGFEQFNPFCGSQSRTVVTDGVKHGAALRRAKEAERKRERAELGIAFVNTSSGSDAFSKLSRYEVAIERSMFRNLHELQRLQAARAGQPVPPPVAVDMEVSSGTG